jgi:hypothetical protein
MRRKKIYAGRRWNEKCRFESIDVMYLMKKEALFMEEPYGGLWEVKREGHLKEAFMKNLSKRFTSLMRRKK